MAEKLNTRKASKVNFKLPNFLGRSTNANTDKVTKDRKPNMKAPKRRP